MKILFEEYPYKTEDVSDILGEFVLSGMDLARDKQQLKCVGYFFNREVENRDGSRGDLVFILPKVLIDENGMVFGMKADDKRLRDFNWKEWKKDESMEGYEELTKRKVYDFIYGFSTWIYRALEIYQKREQDDEAEVLTSISVGNSKRKVGATYMDIILSLLDFGRKNQDFIMFVIKSIHAGMSKISWQRTIAKSQAYVDDDTPIYVNPINKKRVVNFDEELMVIYYSILNYINTEFGFPIKEIPGYELIVGKRFEAYLKGLGKRRLMKIRYKYYSDKAIELWNLCYAFFEKAESVYGRIDRDDYLMVRKFETVFEAMIDELIGDKELPKGLKVQSDAKRSDHIYTYKHLIENMEGVEAEEMSRWMYNIADSKYYGRNQSLRGTDVPKQFTYARNVIQWHMDLLHDLYGGADKEEVEERYAPIPLYDERTEGFNVIPNFFISAKADKELDYENGEVSESTLPSIEKGNVRQSYIFWERLFDRNTYFTLHYDVNFLFVLKRYAQNRTSDKSAWRRDVHRIFREGMLDFMNNEFDFYQILTPDIDRFVETYFRQLRGKVFSFKTKNGNVVLLYAERRNQAQPEDKYKNSYKFVPERDTHIENDVLVIPIGGKRKKFYRVVKMTLGKSEYEDVDKYVILPNKKGACETNSKDFGDVADPSVRVGLIGCYDEDYLEWIEHFHIYYIRDYKTVSKTELSATFLILYNEKLGTHFYKIKSLFPKPMLKDEKYNEFNNHEVGRKHDHYMYELGEEEVFDIGVSSGWINKKIKPSAKGDFLPKGIILPKEDAFIDSKQDIKIYDFKSDKGLLFAAEEEE